jgi:hypothetical protein
MIELPEQSQPRPVRKAAGILRDREADVATARAAVEEAKAAITEGVRLDREQYAAALDAGRDDPGTPHEDAAQAGLVAAERRLAAEEERRGRAQAALVAALVESIDAWDAALAKAVTEAEADVLDLVAKLEAAEHERARRRMALSWARSYRLAERLPRLDHVAGTPSTVVINSIAGPGTYTVEELLTHVRDSIERVTLGAETARAAERQAREQPGRLHAA